MPMQDLTARESTTSRLLGEIQDLTATNIKLQAANSKLVTALTVIAMLAAPGREATMDVIRDRAMSALPEAARKQL